MPNLRQLPILACLVLPFLFTASCSEGGANAQQRGEPAERDTVTGQVAWQHWGQEAFGQAKAQHKLVLLDLAANWCRFCHKMDATTWQDPAVLAEIAGHYIPVRIQDEFDPELAEKYRHYGRPAIVVLDASGKELYRKPGYQEPQQMQWTLQGVVQDAGTGGE